MKYIYFTAVTFDHDVKGKQFAVWDIEGGDKFMLPVLHLGLDDPDITKEKIHKLIDGLIDNYKEAKDGI